MLVLSRKPGEKVYVGREVTFTVLEVEGRRVRIGIDAPTHVRIVRGELREATAERPAQMSCPPCETLHATESS
jgi:carbon storage regulator